MLPAQYSPVPARRPGKQARVTEDLTDRGERGAAIWQYESPDFEAAASLPVLSLFVPEAPTQPQPPVAPRLTRRLPAVDEIDTVPPPARPSLALVPAPEARGVFARPAQESTSRTLVERMPAAQPEAASWTAGQGSNSSYARLIAGPARRRGLRLVNPLDNLRWWLLRPGHIESLLWLCGTALLVLVTCALLFAFAFSFQSIIPGTPLSLPVGIGDNGASGAQQQAHSPLAVALASSGPITPGGQIRLQGQGFSRNGLVMFYLDGKVAILDVHGKAAQARADALGVFTQILWLGVGSGWTTGAHHVAVLDMASGQRFLLPITLVAGKSTTTIASTSSQTPVVPVTSSTSTPGTTHTPLPTLTPAPQGSPVNKTPVPTSPTPSPAPTHTPTATPTASLTPTTSPTVSTSPTPGTTPAASPTANSASLSNALSQSGDPPFGSPLVTVSPLVWCMIACYTLSMTLLGFAGLLLKKRRASRA